MANLMNFTPTFEFNLQALLFFGSACLVTLGLLCEAKYRRETEWRSLKKESRAGIRTVEPKDSTQGGWE
jgi:hypothetical protein